MSRKTKSDRREFLSTISVAGAGLAMGLPTITLGNNNSKPAILGGPKAHPNKFPDWPIIGDSENEALLEVLKSKAWGRLNGNAVASFETEYKKLTGAKHCLGVSSGTSALYTALGAMDIGPGDEVIIPVYTFIATYNVVVLNYALPIFVDTEIESFQIDAKRIKEAITDQTKVIMPVHMGGAPADLDLILSLANGHNIPVLEDACQAHLAEWRGKKVGTFGLTGAFSFQSSKNLNSGEGGALLSDDDQFAENCYKFHNQGFMNNGQVFSTSSTRATNHRLTEFQGRLLLAQMKRLEDQTTRRTQNAAYLTQLLNEISGIYPAKHYVGVTRCAYHLYMFRYEKGGFSDLPRSKFLEALNAEGVPCAGGYGKMNKEAYVTNLAKNKHYLKIYGDQTMQQWLERNSCPQNDILCEQAVWLGQSLLLGTKEDMEQIAEAILKIKNNSNELAKT